MKNKFFALLTLCSVLFAFSFTASAADKLKVGAVLLTREHVFWNILEENLIKAAEKYNIDLIVVDGKASSDVQYGQVQDFITQGVDAIVLSPASSAGSKAASDLAKESGIPVFCLNIKSDGDFVTFVGTDEIKGGQLAGEFVAKALGGKGKTAIITYDEIEQCTWRADGFKSVLKEYPGIEVVSEMTYSGDVNKAASVTQDFLTQFPDLDYIFAVGDPAAVAAVETIKGSGMDVKVVGYDGNPEAISGIKKDGKVWKADIAQDPAGSADKMLKVVADYLRDNKKPESEILISPYVIDMNYIEKNGL